MQRRGNVQKEEEIVKYEGFEVPTAVTVQRIFL
jgi:hypothetical protein